MFYYRYKLDTNMENYKRKENTNYFKRDEANFILTSLSEITLFENLKPSSIGSYNRRGCNALLLPRGSY